MIYTATDIFGITTTCAAEINVVDTTAPAITCPAPITVEATGPDGATVDVAPATASDIAGGAVVTDPAPGGAVVTDPAPAVYPLGTTTVTETATDQVGLTSTCSTTVTVVQSGPTSKAQCKNGGWRSFGDRFRNQGECVALFGT